MAKTQRKNPNNEISEMLGLSTMSSVQFNPQVSTLNPYIRPMTRKLSVNSLNQGGNQAMITSANIPLNQFLAVTPLNSTSVPSHLSNVKEVVPGAHFGTEVNKIASSAQQLTSFTPPTKTVYPHESHVTKNHPPHFYPGSILNITG